MELTRLKKFKNEGLPKYEDGTDQDTFARDNIFQTQRMLQVGMSPKLKAFITEGILPNYENVTKEVQRLQGLQNKVPSKIEDIVTSGIGISSVGVLEAGAKLGKYNKTVSDMNTEAGSEQQSVAGNMFEAQRDIDSNKMEQEARAEADANTMNMMSKTAALGASAGSIIPGLGPVAGGVLGAVAGGLAGLFGKSSTLKKAKERIRKQQFEASVSRDVNRSAAISDWMNQRFERIRGNQASQQLYRDGKMPTFTYKGVELKEKNSAVQSGETIARMSENGNISSPKRIPSGFPNDSAPANLKDNDIVFTEKYGIADQSMYDPYGAYIRQGMLKQEGLLKSKDGFKFGKMPKYKDGKIDWMSNAIPSSLGMMAGLAQYFGAKRETPYRPNTYRRNPYANNALSILAGLRMNELPILNQLRNAEARSNYALNNSGGLSGAQKYIGKIATAKNTQNSIAQALAGLQNYNNQYRSQYANALLQTGAQEAANRMTAMRADDDVYMKSHAARQQGMQMGIYNILNNLNQYAANEFKRKQFNSMYGLYTSELSEDAKKWLKNYNYGIRV